MKAAPIVVYLPDTRGVELARYGMGNAKIGFGVFTYSRPPGYPRVGLAGDHHGVVNIGGTCPGSTEFCESVCYAKRIVGPVAQVHAANRGNDVPPIPAECKLLRIHVSGDFDTPEYILNWVERLKSRPDVMAWAYTRSWRCHSLLEFLEQLRVLPNVELFASMDPQTQDLPPAGWRRAWIQTTGETRLHITGIDRSPGSARFGLPETYTVADGESGYVCPEETQRKANCVECGYCFLGKKHDVVFLEH